ncbi:xylogalacturonan beta-1,3-xylosyltransferase-like [Lycium barbarum]|uniref:xylogalacturonan beta-1,3-xylosyltransferase-like n=1 Tax=Lycium barbarum TaxID=112863 RepID=UPI00293E15D9|nr:xylogalacturonan beta-1,3-xylosyltransferase-like [Lycium barbarum]XP_060208328.1 xylogalacturonan beta-1,3-xylosyltransferase-like [Lycium barbarum]XP_060208329.1 xylogalacturonan beta-1,3-xylosyltransferase-like [Lycium barbarum]
MGSEIRYLGLLETRRLVWLSGVVFAIVLMIQYFGFPYGYALSSLFTANVGQISSSQRVDQSGNLSGSGNMTHASVVNATNTNLLYEASNETKLSDGKNEKIEDDSMTPMNERSGDTLTEDVDPEDESPFKDSETGNKSTVKKLGSNSSLPPDKAADSEYDLQASNGTSENSSSSVFNTHGGGSISPAPMEAQSLDISPTEMSVAPPPMVMIPQVNADANNGAPLVSVYQNISAKEGNTGQVFEKGKVPGQMVTDHAPSVSHTDHAPSVSHSSISNSPVMKESDKPKDSIVSIAEMNIMQQQSCTSFRSMKPWWSADVDQELLRTKSLIENAPPAGNEPGLYAPLYRNLSMFKRSYELMEQILKVYIYTEGERPVFHTPVLKGIYASEGWFMKLLKRDKKFVTKNPKKAHLFYLPFSSRMLEETLYVPNSHSRRNLVRYLSDYLNTIIQRHNFWNRTAGADHFLVACHDWAPAETKRIMANCIRALCNADIKEGFQFGKDVSLPETYVRTAKNPLREIGGKRLSKRRTLAFFAGNMHGYLRPILLNYWENKDPDMKIFGKISTVSYVNYMKSSKYCICAKGYEVNSPRVVEAIFYECVPVIISDNFIPPFFEILNWEAFAIFVPEKDIPKLKDILVSIPEKRYREMQRRVKLVQQHFLWHVKPVKYDIFYMTLHSIWHNRVYGVTPR